MSKVRCRAPREILALATLVVLPACGAAPATAPPPGPWHADSFSISTDGRTADGILDEGDAFLGSGELADVYYLEPTGSKPLQVAVESEDFDAYLIVRPPFGEQLDDAGDSDRKPHAVVELPTPAAAPHQIVVTTRRPGQNGRYRLRIDNGRILRAITRPALLASDGAATYGSLSAQPGFQPDPLQASGLAGGSIDARIKDPDCHGFIHPLPDYLLTVRSPFHQLRLFVLSQEETTLIVQAPDGTLRCAGTTAGVAPSLEGPVQPGIHRVWIGSARRGHPAPYELGISELPSEAIHSRAGGGR